MKEPKVIEKYNKEKIKQFKRQLKSKEFDLDNELLISENGSAIIQCNVEKTKYIFSNFDPIQDRSINDVFHNFLLEETEIIPIRYDLQLQLLVDDDFTTENEIQVQKAIKRHYSFCITKDKVIQNKTFKKYMLLLLVGLFGLVLIPILRALTPQLQYYEFLTIPTWFFIWEAISTKIYDSSEIKMHKFNMLRLYNAEIVFIKKSSKTVKTESVSNNNLQESETPLIIEKSSDKQQ